MIHVMTLQTLKGERKENNVASNLLFAVSVAVEV